jgi:hypothetical protein
LLTDKSEVLHEIRAQMKCGNPCEWKKKVSVVLGPFLSKDLSFLHSYSEQAQCCLYKYMEVLSVVTWLGRDVRGKVLDILQCQDNHAHVPDQFYFEIYIIWFSFIFASSSFILQVRHYINFFKIMFITFYHVLISFQDNNGVS